MMKLDAWRCDELAKLLRVVGSWSESVMGMLKTLRTSSLGGPARR
jgi:hypothetical protein